jgi:hypothetical protein
VSYLNLLMGGGVPDDSGTGNSTGGGTASAATGGLTFSGTAADTGAGTASAGTGTAAAAAFSVDMFAATGVGSARINLASNAVLAQATYTTITLEAWIKPSTITPAAWATIFGFGTSGDQVLIALATDSTLRAYSGSTISTGPSSLTANTWAHVAWTGGATGGNRWYINGVQSGSIGGQPSLLLNSTPRMLGGDAGTEVFRGRLSDLRIWTVERSAAQILANYNKRLVGNEAGLVGYWKMNEGSGTTVADSTSGAFNGTFSSGTDVTWVSDMPTFV